MSGRPAVLLGRQDLVTLQEVGASAALGSRFEWPFGRAAHAAAQFGECVAVREVGSTTVVCFSDTRAALRQRLAAPQATEAWTVPPVIPGFGESQWAAERRVKSEYFSSGGSTTSGPAGPQRGRQPKVTTDPLLINPEQILSSRDQRRTVMLKGLPPTWTREGVAEILERVVPRAYDCYILPNLPFKRSDGGVAFVHFKKAESILPLFNAVHGHEWVDEQGGTSVRGCIEVRYSTKQGRKRIEKAWGRLDTGLRAGMEAQQDHRGGSGSGGDTRNASASSSSQGSSWSTS